MAEGEPGLPTGETSGARAEVTGAPSHMPGTEIPQVDVHSHLIPGVDDGARDEAMALAMLQVASADGTRIIAATPHAGEVHPEAIPGAVRRLNELARAAEIPIEVIPGCEYKLSRALGDEHKLGRLMTLNGTPYVLVELPDWNQWPNSVGESITSLRDDGLWPILAHPERHPPVQRCPELVLEAVQVGALVQLNAGSFLGHNGREAQRAAVLLLSARAAHLIASDAHHPEARPPRVADALARAAALAGEEYVRWMRWAAMRVVTGEPVELPEPDLQALRLRESWLERIRDWLANP